jgi:putative GTP pyrophosphokinase
VDRSVTLARTSGVMSELSERPETLLSGEDFDAAEHRKAAVEAYQSVRRLYEDFAITVKRILEQTLSANQIAVHSIEARAKSLESFGRKAQTLSASDPSQPKYEQPLTEITDLAGVRVITFFIDNLAKVDALIDREFEVLEKTNRSELLAKEEKLGYQSVHYIVKFKATRSTLPEYARLQNLLAEIQARTILQHAWQKLNMIFSISLSKPCLRRFADVS